MVSRGKNGSQSDIRIHFFSFFYKSHVGFPHSRFPFLSVPFVTPPSSPPAFGICIAVFACLLIPIFFVVEVVRRRDEADSLLEAVRSAFRPNADWCPKDAILRREYQEFKASHKPVLEGIDNPLPPVASSVSLASQNAAPVTQYNTSV